MKKFAYLLKEQLDLFLGRVQPEADSLEEDPLTPIKETIDLAIRKKAAVHIIYGDKKSATGIIIKWDPVRQQVILSLFSNNMTTFILLEEIQRISLVPESIKELHQKQKKKSKS